MKTEDVKITTSSEDGEGDGFMTISVQCLRCKHLRDNLWSCDAFPDGIPDLIMGGGWDHRKAFKGDDGIRFEKKE
jgi:hypothetical protein